MFCIIYPIFQPTCFTRFNIKYFHFKNPYFIIPFIYLFFFSFSLASDHSGFRIHYSKHLRKHDGGVMISGVSVSDTQLIPPGQKLYRNVGICGPSCSNEVNFNNTVKKHLCYFIC